MLLTERLEKIGEVFFRHRSYVPLSLLVVIVLKKTGFLTLAGAQFFPGGSFFEFFCFTSSALGLSLRALATGFSRAGTSGRSTKAQSARSLNTDGLYSIARHPLYLGNFFSFFGVCAFSKSIEVIVIYFLFFFCFYIPIMLREEKFLRENFGEAFLGYAARVPALVPRLSLWRRPELPFNFLRLLYREHDTWMGILWGFCLVRVISDSVALGKFYFDGTWLRAFTYSVLFWCLVKTFKKKLKSLDRGL